MTCFRAGVLLATIIGATTLSAAFAADATRPADGSVLPFPSAPSASVAAPTLQESGISGASRRTIYPRTRPTF